MIHHATGHQQQSGNSRQRIISQRWTGKQQQQQQSPSLFAGLGTNDRHHHRRLHRSALTIPRGGSAVEESDVIDLDTNTNDERNIIDGEEDHTAEQVVTPSSSSSSSTTTTKLSSSSPISIALAHISTFATKFATSYSLALEARPIITKSITAGIIFGLSDYLAQMIEQRSDGNSSDSKNVNGSNNKSGRNNSDTTGVASFDTTRFIASALIGLLYFGPAAHYWYEWIFKLFPATTLLSTMVKAFWGQVIFGPSFTCIFFATSLLQSGDFTMKNWWMKIRTDLPGAWLAGSGYWPIVDLISYSLVPVKLIPLFINMASLIWTVYLSIIANK